MTNAVPTRSDAKGSRPFWRRLKFWFVVYVALLGASHVWRAVRGPQALDDAELVTEQRNFVRVPAFVDDGLPDPASSVRLVYEDWGPRDAPVIVGLHGSPGDRSQLRGVAQSLADRYRTLLPDLPGFGLSDRDVPSYSVAAHARYVEALLDELDIDAVHLAGFSMGGGVALELDALLGERARSIAMISAIGVQELELLGDYHLNHALHGLQLGALWLFREGFPHFGLNDHSFFGVEYARNFYDTDQRPLRELLESRDKPLLLIHGEQDELVPMAAAIEHARIVPQARFERFARGHFLVFQEAERVAAVFADFITAVENGSASTRADAEPAALVIAAAEFEPSKARLSGFFLGLIVTLIAISTLASEDLACIGTGAMVAQGRIGFVPGALACFVGIFIGDLMLYGIGRLLGRRAVELPPLCWVLSEKRVERASTWFEEKGLLAIFLTRFTPGMRLPTYVAAGALRARLSTFALYFAIAAGVWTPILVWISSLIGGELIDKVEAFRNALPLALLATVTIGLFVVKIGVPMLTWRGRRGLVGSLRRKTTWEFWPPWLVYPPVVLYGLWLALRHRSLTVFCAANPGIPDGGFVGESKCRILEAFGQRSIDGSPAAIPDFVDLPRSLDSTERLERFDEFAARSGGFPLVVKPDAGQRGSGVMLAQSADEARDYVAAGDVDLLAQTFVAGPEFGVFYARRAAESVGRVLSLTTKHLAVVEGDGTHTVEHLILHDPRAVCMAGYYLDRNAARLDDVPAAGEQVVLGELGTHARGAIFLDGQALKTPELERAIDALAQNFEGGFQFGRFDIRAPSEEALRAGRDLSVLELNGVTSEMTHVYDPKHSVFEGWRTLCLQWKSCFEIGAENRDRGVPVPTVRALFKAWRDYRRGQHHHRGG